MNAPSHFSLISIRFSKSKSYSGTTEFTFKVNRFFNEETGEILLESEMPEGSEDQFKPMVVELEVSGEAYFSPGR
jgi:CYTH domain-containing protein